MDNNKQNSVLLIIIAVATLLVAVVGATFAYFTAYNSSGSTVTVNTKTGSMNILFSDGDDKATVSKTDIQPSNTVLVKKEFTITGNNITKTSSQTVTPEGNVTNGTETSMLMPFAVKLKYTTTFINNELHVLVKQTQMSNDYTQGVKDIADAPAQLKGDTKLNTYYDFTIGSGTTKGQETTSELELVYGEFKDTSNAITNANVIKFEVLIVFPDTGENQDDNKQAKFDGILQVEPVRARVAA